MCLHPDVIDALAAAGATVQMIAAAYRAAWKAERGEPDTAAPQVARVPQQETLSPAAIRQRRSRANKKARDSQIEMFPVTLASVTEPRDSVTPSHDSENQQRKVPTPLKETTSLRAVEDGGGGARATPLVLISPKAIRIAEAMGAVAGLDPDPMATPPGWCGAAARVETWLAHFTEDEIMAGVRAGMAGKRDGPPETPRYFEKPIARIHLQLTAPIPAPPEVSYARVRERRPATDWQSRRDNWHAARAELDAAVAAAGGG